ncbi:YkvA family protein [Bacillus sp. B6(2022)]|nr:YkvA family protein [Bacillus sp. B6(2022)]
MGKVKKTAQKAGVSLVYAVLLLYYTLQKPEVPVKAKTLIIGALGYFILPIDLIPDTLVGIGYTDDLGAITFALLQVAMYIDDDVKGKAKDRLGKWFGEKAIRLSLIKSLKMAVCRLLKEKPLKRRLQRVDKPSHSLSVLRFGARSS